MYGNNESKWFFQGNSTEPNERSGQRGNERNYESYSELIEELYPICLEAGITPALFYESTLGEIYDLLLAYNKREKIRQKEMITSNYMLAYHIGERVGNLLNSENTIHELWDLYPDLFEEEKKINEEVKRKAEIEEYKAKFTAFAYNINLK